ncbi:MAG TPA: hypothetical protein VGC34_09940 [Steroidobacteraceae bacterium]
MAVFFVSYPLNWPKGWTRTPPAMRQPPRFSSAAGSVVESRPGRVEIKLKDAHARLERELRMLLEDGFDEADAVLSSNIQPSHGRPASPDDPGAAVFFKFGGRPIVLACDRWTTVAGNVAAISRHLGAMRGMTRWGVGSFEQAFTGYRALPPPDDPLWQEVLGNPNTLDEAELFYSNAIVKVHPNRHDGGDADLAARLTAAIADARAYFRAAA